MKRFRGARGATGAVIDRIVKKIVADLSPKQIVLFGSHATGEPGPDSDIDLLVVRETSEDFYRRMATVRRTVSGLHPRIPLGPIVLTPSEIEDRLKRGDQFIEGILKRGKVLYAA